MLTDEQFKTLWEDPSVEILQSFDIFKWLYRKVEALNPKIIIETGVEQGGSLRFWVEAIQPGGKIIAVDCSKDLITHVAKHYDIKQFLPEKEIILIQHNADKESVKDIIQEHVGYGQADFLFIDAGHSYPGEKLTFDYCSPFLKKGALVAWDDIYPSEAGVVRSWEECRDRLDQPQVVFDESNGKKSLAGKGIGYIK